MKYENFNRTTGARRALLAPLDWGLGHATRCIPLIHHLQSHGYEVVIAAEGNIATLLQQEFPQIRQIGLKGYNIRYSRSGSRLPFTLLLQLPKLWRAVYRERKWLKKLLQQESFDIVISDNRLGLSHPALPCYYITHQLLIKTGNRLTEWMAQRLHYHFINRYKACWVPDMAGEKNLAGDLSHPARLPRIPVHYLGPLSRFTASQAEKKWDCCILLSGPEPQRSIFENILLKQLAGFKGNAVLVRGMPGNTVAPAAASNTTLINHLPAGELAATMQAASLVICRSGYSSVMDLVALQQKAVLVPTPGQTEQEYLAGSLMEKKIFPFVLQEDFDLKQAIAKAGNFDFQFPVFTTGIKLPDIEQLTAEAL